MGKDKYADKAGKTTPSSPKQYDTPVATAPVATPEVAPVVASEVVVPEKSDEQPKGEVKGRAHIVSYLSSAKSRHKELPQELLGRMEKSKTKGEAKKVLRDYLRKIPQAVDVV